MRLVPRLPPFVFRRFLTCTGLCRYSRILILGAVKSPRSTPWGPHAEARRLARKFN